MVDIEDVDHNWTEFYPDSEEELPGDIPDPRMNPVNAIAYFDVDHKSDLFTCFSVTGALVYVNSAPIK